MRELVAACLLLSLPACTVQPTEQVDSSIEAPPCATRRLYGHGANYTLFFAPGSASLAPHAQTILDALAAKWRRADGRFVELSGHVDAQEARTARPSLALERAEAAKSFLVAQGIDPRRVITEGFGASHPLIKTDRVEPQNRRVEPRPIFFGSSDEDRRSYLDRLTCRIWVRDHCFTPSRLTRAGAAACNAALDAS